MKLAEELYQAGFISYPRTETDVFDPGQDLRVGGGWEGCVWVGGRWRGVWVRGGWQGCGWVGGGGGWRWGWEGGGWCPPKPTPPNPIPQSSQAQAQAHTASPLPSPFLLYTSPLAVVSALCTAFPTAFATNPPPPPLSPQAIVSEQSVDPRWGAHCRRLLSGELWRQPRPGGHDDKAHPPIHPTRHSQVRGGDRRGGGRGGGREGGREGGGAGGGGLVCVGVLG